jgi:hypothetical protein
MGTRMMLVHPVYGDLRPICDDDCCVQAGRSRRFIVSRVIGIYIKVRKQRWLGDVIDLVNPQVVADDLPIAFVWTGLEQSFLKAGFTEVARRSPKRPILRSQT